VLVIIAIVTQPIGEGQKKKDEFYVYSC